MSYEIEDLRELFSEVGIEANDEDMEYIRDQIINDRINSADRDSLTHDYSPECDNCKRLEDKIKRLEKENGIYEEYVKKKTGAALVEVNKGNAVLRNW